MELTINYILSQIFTIIMYGLLALTYYAKDRKKVLIINFLSVWPNHCWKWDLATHYCFDNIISPPPGSLIFALYVYVLCIRSVFNIVIIHWWTDFLPVSVYNDFF